ncbi:hypothetical protein FGIG_06097, partial [Fasciola gigantica]
PSRRYRLPQNRQAQTPTENQQTNQGTSSTPAGENMTTSSSKHPMIHTTGWILLLFTRALTF